MHTYGQGRWVAWTYCGVAIGINYDAAGLGQYGVGSRRLYWMSSQKVANPSFRAFAVLRRWFKNARWSCRDLVDSACIARNRKIGGSYMGVGTSLESCMCWNDVRSCKKYVPGYRHYILRNILIPLGESTYLSMYGDAMRARTECCNS